MVEFLQNILKILGLYTGKIDGIYGPNLRNAIFKFQKQNKLIEDGIVGPRTWLVLRSYIDGGLGFIVPTNIRYSSSILQINLDTLIRLYPFIEITSAGRSVLGTNLPIIKIGNGAKEVFYSASFHANEWICSPLVMKFLADYCYCYSNNLPIFGVNARNIYNYCTIYIMPMVNPDGVDLVTGEISPNSSLYTNTELIAKRFPNIPFPGGWKANIRTELISTYNFLKVGSKQDK